MKSLLIAALAIVALASCTKQNLIPENQAADGVLGSLDDGHADQFRSAYKGSPALSIVSIDTDSVTADDWSTSKVVTLSWTTNAGQVHKMIDHYEYYADTVIFAYNTELDYQHMEDFSTGVHKFAVRVIATDGTVSDWKYTTFTAIKN